MLLLHSSPSMESCSGWGRFFFHSFKTFKTLITQNSLLIALVLLSHGSFIPRPGASEPSRPSTSKFSRLSIPLSLSVFLDFPPHCRTKLVWPYRCPVHQVFLYCPGHGPHYLPSLRPATFLLMRFPLVARHQSALGQLRLTETFAMSDLCQVSRWWPVLVAS